MKSIFHIARRPGGAIAWNVHGKALLILNKHFHELAKMLWKGKLNEREITKFALRVTTHTKIIAEKEHQKRQREFHRMLLGLLDKGTLDLEYSLNTADAQKSVDDFLEVNKFNHSRIAYAVGKLYNEDDEVLNISLRKDASILQRLTGRLGDPYDEINIRRSRINGLVGNAFEFTLTLKDGTDFRFSETGIDID